jgi:glycosyltransferase involved in cell wall biosynthesis
MLNVIAYTGGHNTPSSVPRVQQYIPGLRELGIRLVECPSRAGSFPPERKWARPAWGLWNLAEHIPATLRSYRYDVVLLHREMLVTMVTLERFAKKPRVLDVDDAIWVHRGGGFARRLAAMCDHVLCGNAFLAEHFSQWNPKVSVLPTPVDTRRFTPLQRSEEPPVIGWLGLSDGFRYLYAIEPALLQVLRRHPEVRLRIVSNRPPKFSSLPAKQVEFVPYAKEREVAEMRNAAIGIMPLDDSVVSRGKCSYKMLQYMACGVPVVVSEVGMNGDVLRRGEVGFGVQTVAGWIDALETLLGDTELRARMGACGREVVCQHYSTETLAPGLAATLFAVSEGRQPHPAVASGGVCR